jgi:hypothetical protein
VSIHSGPAGQRSVRSSGTIVTGTSAWVSTRWAASGSQCALNSATPLVLPAPSDPPIQTIRSIRDASSGCTASRSAMFVSGPIGTSVTG